MVLHATKPPFDDPRMRRAVFLAIDRKELTEITRCRGELGCFGSQGNFSPRKGGFNVEPLDELAQVPGWRQPKDQDIADAKLLMAEASYADGVDGLTWNLSSNPTTVNTAEVVSEQLRTKLGIDIKLDIGDRASSLARIRDGTHNMSSDGSGVIISDPSDYLNQHFTLGTHKNPDNWSDPRLTPLIDAQARELDPAKRLALFKEALEILREGESTFVPMTWGYSGALLDYRLQGYNVPESEQQIKMWEGLWWDPDAELPPP